MTEPLPRRIAWFRHWTPWKRKVLLAAVLIAVYIEGPVIATAGLLVTMRSGLKPSIGQLGTYNAVYMTIFFPLLTATKRFKVVNSFYGVQIGPIAELLRPKRKDGPKLRDSIPAPVSPPGRIRW